MKIEICFFSSLFLLINEKKRHIIPQLQLYEFYNSYNYYIV